MLNFDILDKGLGIAHFVYGFSTKLFLKLYSINWPKGVIKVSRAAKAKWYNSVLAFQKLSKGGRTCENLAGGRKSNGENGLKMEEIKPSGWHV